MKKSELRKMIREEILNELSDDYDAVFQATSRGGKEHLKVYQSDVDKKYNSYSYEDRSGGGGWDARDVKGQILSQLIGSMIDDTGTYSKLIVDKLGVWKEFEVFAKEYRKKYRHFFKEPKGSDNRKLYYNGLWAISDAVRKGQSLKSQASKIMKMIDAKS